MKITHWLIASLIVFLAGAGCQDEQIPSGMGHVEQPDGTVRFTFCIDAPLMNAPTTRTGTADEDAMAGGDFWVFVFDNTNTPADPSDIKLLEVAKASPTTSTVAPYKWVTTLKTYNHPVKVLMVANAPAQVYAADGTGGTAISSTSFPADMTYADAQAKLYTKKLGASLATVPYTNPKVSIPMCLAMDFNELTSQTNLGTEAAPLQLPRVVAKITVDNTTPTDNTDFVLVGANLHKAPAASCLVQRTIVTNATGLTKYEGTTTGQEITDIAAAAPPNPATTGIKETTAANPLYCYEANANDLKNLFLIIEGTYKGVKTYYKAAIGSATNGTVITAIERNKHYQLVIKKCAGKGYDTLDEAIAGPSFNLIYDVKITDLSSHDMIDNGQYYIGLSNSEYHFYAENSFQNLPVATLHTGTNQGAYAFNGKVSIISSDPTNLLVQTATFDHPAVNQTIVVNVTKDFVEGTLTVRLGNLSKEIKVVRKSNRFIEIKDELIVNDAYKDPRYKVASVVDPKPWIKLSTSPNATLATGHDRVATDAGGVYIAYNANMARPDLENFVYISRSTHEGRIKAHFLLSPLVFISTDAPEVVDRNGQRLGTLSKGPHNFIFSNPSGYNYKVALFPNEGNPTIQSNVASIENSTAQKELEYSDLKEDNREILPRVFVAKVQVGKYWYEIPYQVQQRYDLKINILTVGSNGIDYHRAPSTATSPATVTSLGGNTAGMFGIKIGTVSPIATSNKYSDGLGRLLYNQTGAGKPINMPLQMYYLCDNAESTAGTTNYDNDKVLKALENNNIDILVCFAHGQNWGNSAHGPSILQANDIINKWLLKSKYRGMIYTCDGLLCNTNWTKAIFDTVQAHSPSATPLIRLPSGDRYYDHPVYRSIMSGSYSRFEGYPTAADPVLKGSNQNISVVANKPITGATSRTYVRNSQLDPIIGLRNQLIPFYSPTTYGYLTISRVQSKGFIPLLYKNENEVTLAVHPDKRIVFQGELQYYDAGGHGSVAVINADGGLAATEYGPYPKLMMNLWEWFFNNVALGKKY